jgi:hypothetical protein
MTCYLLNLSLLDLRENNDAMAIPIVMTLMTDHISRVICKGIIGLYIAAVTPRIQVQSSFSRASAFSARYANSAQQIQRSKT